MPKFQQISLVAAITKELGNQQPSLTINQEQLNTLITAANSICAAFEQPETPVFEIIAMIGRGVVASPAVQPISEVN